MISSSGATRGLGWDMNSSYSVNRAICFRSARLVTGFTGTSMCSILRARCLSCF